MTGAMGLGHVVLPVPGAAGAALALAVLVEVENLAVFQPDPCELVEGVMEPA